MSVIAKMNVTDIRAFGKEASLIKLNCVYESNGLNSNGEGWENKRFTTATPWGEGDLSTPFQNRFRPYEPWVEGHKQQAVYLVFAKAGDVNDAYKPRHDCLLDMFVRCSYVESWPGSKAISFSKDRNADKSPNSIALKMAIDNPAASDQFEEGGTYYLCFYDADKTSLHEACAGA